VLQGRGRIYYGEGYSEWVDMEEGDFVFVPPFMPHVEVNLSTTNHLVWLTTRTPENIVVNLPPPRSVPSEAFTIASAFSSTHSATALGETWSRYLSLQEIILVVPRTQDVQTSLAINRPCAAGIDVVSLDRRTPANEKKG